MNIMDEKFAIIDIETTGGNAVTGKITEIAIFIFQNNQIIDQLVSLVNPEQNIPYFISSLTGIDDKMVEQSPKFYELAKSIIEITEDAVFVAHNVNFDYGFIKEEFKQLGYDYNRKTLCTVQLSRKIIPGQVSYSLGKLCQNLGIVLNNRHRAEGDALATVELFRLLVNTNSEFIEQSLTLKKYRYKHPFLSKEKIDHLPETSGLYCFKNNKNEVIYIGRSINIKERVIAHLNQTKSKKMIKMLDEVKFVDYRETGSELIALLEESQEIKRLNPKFNKALAKMKFSYGIFHYQDDKGYINFEVRKLKNVEDVPLITYPSIKQCQSILLEWVQRFELCQKKCGLYDSVGACFYYGLGDCKGACVDIEPVDVYNGRVKNILAKYAYFSDNFIIIDRGRNASEKSVVLIESSIYRGHSFFPIEALKNIETLKFNIPIFENNKDIQNIINAYIKKHPELKIIQF